EDACEHNRYGARFPQQCGQGRSAVCREHIRHHAHKFRRVSAHLIRPTAPHARLHPDVAAVRPAQLLQLLLERLDASAGFWVAFAESTEQYRDLLRSVLLLRARRLRPRRRAAEQRDELAPSIKKTRSHGTIAKRAGLAKRPRSAKGLPFSSSRVGRKGRCVTH